MDIITEYLGTQCAWYNSTICEVSNANSSNSNLNVMHFEFHSVQIGKECGVCLRMLTVLENATDDLLQCGANPHFVS